MNIIFLSRLFYPHIGGVETHIAQISRILLTYNHRITVITTEYDNSLELESTHNNIRIIRIPRQNATSKLGIWSWIQHHKPLFQTADIIHAHDVVWWLFNLIPFLKQPIFSTFHGWEGVYPLPARFKIIRKISEKLCQGNICVGDFLPKWYGTKPDFITYGATTLSKLTPGSRNKIAVFGRISHDNDLPVVLSGLKLIKQKFPKVSIAFIGDGDLSWEAEKLGQVYGFQPNPGRFLEPVHWVIASSYLSILDSLATGRQVISIYTNPLKKDYLTMHPAAPYISMAFNPTSLLDTFSHLYINFQSSRESSPGQLWAISQTWEHVTQLYLKLWSKDYRIASRLFSTTLN